MRPPWFIHNQINDAVTHNEKDYYLLDNFTNNANLHIVVCVKIIKLRVGEATFSRNMTIHCLAPLDGLWSRIPPSPPVGWGVASVFPLWGGCGVLGFWV